MPEKIIINLPYALGDSVVFSACLRDLHKNYPRRYETSLITAYPEVFRYNPYVWSHKEGRAIKPLYYNSISHSNQTPCHFIDGYRKGLEDELGIKIETTDLRGDIYLSDDEKEGSEINYLTGRDKYWVINCGGKIDATVKIWSHKKAQEVVDYFEDEIKFIQVGSDGHNHPRLNGVIDLVGKTSIRQLISVIYHSSGVICPITSHMHMAAAIPRKEGRDRPCIVTAGGREPIHWVQYPSQTLIHTLGSLDCCSKGGCWKSRVVPILDGDTDRNNNLCKYPEKEGGRDIARCMTMISSLQVIEAIKKYQGFYLSITHAVKSAPL